jgi:AraC-like DNA-binding protein
MSMKRQNTLSANQLILASCNKAVSRNITMQAREHDEAHHHPWHQLIFPHLGVLKTRAAGKLHYIPSDRAVLIPAGCEHESWAITPLQFIGVYLSPDLIELDRVDCKVIDVPPFLRELILKVQLECETKSPFEPSARRLVNVLCDQLLLQQEIALELVIPRDKRVRSMVEELLRTPGSKTPLADWEMRVGASARTIARIFEQQTGLTYRRWRSELRLISALPLLEQKIKIQSVALAVGFDSTSAFVYSFKKRFQVTPAQYFRR